jgi:hypothetical protein
MLDQHRDNDYRTAVQFLRLCLRGRWDPAALEAALAQSASSHVDWQAVCQVAQHEGLAPLLYHVTRGWGLGPSPGERRLHARLAAGSGTGIKRVWAELAELPGRRAQLDFCRRNLFPPAGYMHTCYQVPHRLLVPLYHPYRWFLAIRGLA